MPADRRLSLVPPHTQRAVLIPRPTPATTPDPLLKDLLQEDLRLAQRFHHAGAEVKHAVKAFLTADLSEEQRERLALILADLIRLDESKIALVEAVLAPIDKAGQSPATQAPVLPGVAPQAKKKS